MAPWTHLVRFTAEEDGAVYYAACNSGSPQVGDKLTAFKSIQDLGHISSTAEFPVKTIKQVLAPVETGKPIICIGLNYAAHAKEANLMVPTSPPMWYKPSTSLANPGVVSVPKDAHEHFLDYEGELTIVTSKPARDVSVADAPSYILGYTIGNDLTAREQQVPNASGGQFTYAKAFDNAAPVGPVITSTAAFGTVADKKLVTKVNGRVVQESLVDLIRGPAELVSFLSQGRTLHAGTAIMTGTPSGIGWFMEPKSPLKDGDTVEISIDGIGTLSNTMKFE